MYQPSVCLGITGEACRTHETSALGGSQEFSNAPCDLLQGVWVEKPLYPTAARTYSVHFHPTLSSSGCSFCPEPPCHHLLSAESQWTLHSTVSALQPHMCFVFFLLLHFQFFLEFTVLNWYCLFMFVSAPRFVAIEWIISVKWNGQNEACDKIILLPDGSSFRSLRQAHG